MPRHAEKQPGMALATAPAPLSAFFTWIASASGLRSPAARPAPMTRRATSREARLSLGRTLSSPGGRPRRSRAAFRQKLHGRLRRHRTLHGDERGVRHRGVRVEGGHRHRIGIDCRLGLGLQGRAARARRAGRGVRGSCVVVPQELPTARGARTGRAGRRSRRAASRREWRRRRRAAMEGIRARAETSSTAFLDGREIVFPADLASGRTSAAAVSPRAWRGWGRHPGSVYSAFRLATIGPYGDVGLHHRGAPSFVAILHPEDVGPGPPRDEPQLDLPKALLASVDLDRFVLRPATVGGLRAR